MTGVLRLAFKLLVNDRGKFAALLIGITFAVFLTIFVTSMFAGLLHNASATVINVGAKVWVMDRAVNTPANSIPMPDYVLDAVRSISGVEYAVPIYSGVALVKLRDGTYQATAVVGLDDSSLFGRPELIEGDIADIYADNGFVVVKDAEYAKLENPTVGTEFELNDHRGVIIGIARVAASGLFGMPTLYTTLTRAIQYVPSMRYTVSYVLVEPTDEAAAVPRIKEEVGRLGYSALTSDEFIAKTSTYYTYQTGFGTNILFMTVISFVVGLSISGQMFYTFVLENLERFGALKAIGAKGRALVSMILFQTSFTSLTGYGLGIGLYTVLNVIARLRLPDYPARVTFGNLGLALGMVLIIAALSSYIAVRKVLTIEPFDVFRA